MNSSNPVSKDNQGSARDRTLNSVLVKRGDTFTASDMADAIGESKEHMVNLLNHLAIAGDLYLVSEGKPALNRQARYTKNHRGRYLISKLWDGKLKP